MLLLEIGAIRRVLSANALKIKNRFMLLSSQEILLTLLAARHDRLTQVLRRDSGAATDYLWSSDPVRSGK